MGFVDTYHKLVGFIEHYRNNPDRPINLDDAKQLLLDARHIPSVFVSETVSEYVSALEQAVKEAEARIKS